MSMLDAVDVADLTDVLATAQTPTALVLTRYNQNSDQYDALPAQGVQVRWNAERQTRAGGLTGTEKADSGVWFMRPQPFDCMVGDSFDLSGSRGGTIRRVYTDPVLGVVVAEATIDSGVA